MAACNYKEGSMAKRAITAALVGVLSVGTVPMIALAEGVNDGISLMFAEPGTEYSNGSAKVDFWSAANDQWLTSTTVNGIETVNADQLPIYVSIYGVQLAGGSPLIEVTEKNASDYSLSVYRADENGEATGNALAGEKITTAGSYVVVVSALDGDYAGQVFTSRFNVQGVDFPSNIMPYQNGDVDDEDFMYTGSELNVGFKDGATDTALVEGEDYTVTYTYGRKTVDSVVDAGEYVAHLTGLGKYTGHTATVHVKVAKFMLNKKNTAVYVAPFIGDTPTTPTSVTYTDADGEVIELDPSLVTIKQIGNVTEASTKEIWFDVTIDRDVQAAGNIDARDYLPLKHFVSSYKVDAFCDFMYNGSALQDSYELDASKGEDFDVDDIVASYNGNIVKGQQIDTKVVAVDYAEGVVITRGAEQDLRDGVPGEYKITLKVGPSTDRGGQVFAGYKTFTVKIYKGTIAVDSDVYVYGPDSYKTAITSYTTLYDESEVFADSFYVKHVDKAIRAGVDYDWHLEDANGNVINSAVNAGEYKLVMTSDWYKLEGTTEMPVTISKVDLTTLQIGALQKWNGVAGEEYITPNPRVFVFNFDAIKVLGLKVGTGDAVQTLPFNIAVDVEYNDNGIWKPTKSVLDLGQYRVTASVSDDVAANYVLPEGQNSVTLYFTVATPGLFKDVQPSYWGYDVIARAFNAGYMNGTTSPKFNEDDELVEMGVFNPEGTLTRGQVAAVLFNASGEHLDETDAWYSENYGWKTGFDDVDGTQFYGEGIAWCKANGVVNGYTDGTFRPDQAVTREEFISMLANYAKVVLGDTTVGTVATDVLAEFPDGSEVSGWAASNVAWAAANKVAGNGGSLDPTDTMTRAFCAAMLVNYLNPTA